MSTSATLPAAAGFPRLRLPAAAFEVLGYLAVVAAATLAFLAGWLTVNAAVVLTVALLGSLIVLSWVHLGQGRHPVFLFLCAMMLFQGGRLIAYVIGLEPDPMLVRTMAPNPFIIGANYQGIVLLCIALASVFTYAPCRWRYRPAVPLETGSVQQYLPYLYILFSLALPAQAYKNFQYYEFIQKHGSYVLFFANHEALAMSVPFLIRAVPLISVPVFLAILICERRKVLVYVVTALYFASASLILVMGSRGAFFTTIIAVWYIARRKVASRSRLLLSIPMAVAMLLAADVVQGFRESGRPAFDVAPTIEGVLVSQGASIDVTQLAVKYPERFRPYTVSYLLQETTEAFYMSTPSNYYKGRAFGFDATVFLSPRFFSYGYGVSGSYVGESYLLGGVFGVAVISFLMGSGLNLLYKLSAYPVTLFMAVSILPEIITKPRGPLLDWVSTLARWAISICILWVGWNVYNFVIPSRQAAHSESAPGDPGVGEH